MNKFKVVGITNYILGSLALIIPAVMLLIVLPKLSIIYNQFETPPPVAHVYLQNIPGILWGLLGVFFGHKMFKEKGNKLEKFFNWAVIYLVLTLVIGGIMVGLSVISIIGPIYNLSSSL